MEQLCNKLVYVFILKNYLCIDLFKYTMFNSEIVRLQFLFLLRLVFLFFASICFDGVVIAAQCTATF